MARILVIFAHPALEKSRVHVRMVHHIRQMEGIRFHDLYEAYPDFDIDVAREKELLLEHDIIIFQHPFYWYSCPALIKQWEDLVLEHGWAYGPNGDALTGKYFLNAISAGGSGEAYRREGRNRFSIRDFLSPFDQTATLCHMTYLPPFVVHGTHHLSKADIELYAVQYRQLLVALQNESITSQEWKKVNYLNELFPIPQTIQS